MGRPFNDISGKRYKNLLVIEKSYSDKKSLYWKCRCDCGETCYANSNDLRRGRINFCKKCNAIKSYESALNILYTSYRRGAEQRGHSFNLSKPEFDELIKGDCEYCGIKPKQVHHKRGMTHKLIYNGIDRQDNLLGYEINNCVPCCKFCNLSKSRFTLSEFKEWMAWVRGA